MSVQLITRQNFESEVANAAEPVLLDFFAPWCSPCRTLAPLVEEVAEELSPSIRVCKIDIDQEPDLAAQFGVMSIPALMVVKNGKVTASSVGVQPKHRILKMLEEE